VKLWNYEKKQKCWVQNWFSRFFLLLCWHHRAKLIELWKEYSFDFFLLNHVQHFNFSNFHWIYNHFQIIQNNCKSSEKYWKYVVRTAYPTSTYSNWEVLIVQLPWHTCNLATIYIKYLLNFNHFLIRSSFKHTSIVFMWNCEIMKKNKNAEYKIGFLDFFYFFADTTGLN
jgi:hypothetical protein